MTGKIFFTSVLLGSLIVLSYPIHARENKGPQNAIKIPDTGYVQVLTAQDGSTNIGKITKIGTDEIVFETDIGIINIPVDKISNIREVPESSIRNGKYWFPDPNATRLYFAPTGRMLKKGTGYIADYYLFFPTINYGLTENISIGGGMSIFPTGNVADQVYFFTPKVGFKKSNNFSAAVGALVVKFPDFSDEEDTPLVSVLYGVGTYGIPDRSITLGVGYGMVDGDFAEKPMVVLGGEQRMSRRTSFITENWIFPGLENAIISYGIRFFGEELSVDLAFFNVTGEESLFPGIPYVDFVYNF